MDWILPTEITPDEALRRVIGGEALTAEILARRGLGDPQMALAFLDPAHYHPAPPADIPDLEAAARRLHNAIARGEAILVWGDFDVDGQTSTALLVDGLRRLGAAVSYHIPLRLKDGHGVQVEALKGYLAQGIRLILTCDTGIAAHEAAQAAQDAGATMLITDHHALPETLPDAEAVVNPQRLAEGHPLRDLPGVGVSFMLMRELYGLACRAAEADDFLDLAALGIVADVATQRGDTRYLLQLGIERLRNPQRTGLQALMKSAQVDPLNMSADTIGFQVGPRLNALGRLDDARLAVELLTTDDPTYAAQIAAQLETLNGQRRQIENQIYAAAQEQIAKDPSLLNFEALVIGSPHWHAGVIGIVAARLAEQYQRPTVLLVAPEEGIARGSARSTPGVNIGAAIAACADLLVGHGGHPGAAGVALDALNIPMFRRQLSTVVRETRDPEAVTGLPIDAVIGLGTLSMSLAEDLNRLAPFGAGNPPIKLMTPAVRLVSHAPFGANKVHRKVTVEDGSGTQQVITWWRGSEAPLPGEMFDLAFIPRINDYKGRKSLQLEWADSRPVPGYEVEAGPRYEIVDVRADPAAFDPAAYTNYLVWVEPPQAEAVPGTDPERVISRETARRCKTLVIGGAPPHVEALWQMLEISRARTVVVLAQDSAAETPQTFLERLAGLVKYAQKNYPDGVALVKLASATAQREITVRRGLEWLAAKGQIGLEWTEDEGVKFTPGGAGDPAGVEPLQDAIRALLAESRAFRAYFRRADLAMMLR